jgi:hypothetical protein
MEMKLVSQLYNICPCNTHARILLSTSSLSPAKEHKNNFPHIVTKLGDKIKTIGKAKIMIMELKCNMKLHNIRKKCQFEENMIYGRNVYPFF